MSRLALHWQILIAMVAGAVIGVGLNVNIGARESTVPDKHLPAEYSAVEIQDTTNRITIKLTSSKSGDVREVVIDGTRPTPTALATLDELKKKEPALHKLFQTHGRSLARRLGDIA